MYEIIITTGDIKKIVFAVSLVLLILVSVLTVFADNNTTNTTNNTTNRSMAPLGIGVAVTVSPSTVNLGTLMPDGTQHDYPGRASVHVTGFNLFTYTNLYVRASGAFVNTADPSSTIPLSNFEYDNPDTGSEIPFTTSDVLVDRWGVIGFVDETVSMNYHLTIPTFTTNGTYTTTITYSVT